MENMIDSTEGTGFFDGDLIPWFLNHADQAGITLRVAADHTGVGFRKGETLLAEMDCFMQGHEVGGQVSGINGGPP